LNCVQANALQSSKFLIVRFDLLNRFSMEEPSTSEELKLDLVDKKLLNELMRNARTSLTRLAEEMRVAPATLHNR
jgi:transcriptional regulator, AsnC family